MGSIPPAPATKDSARNGRIFCLPGPQQESPKTLKNPYIATHNNIWDAFAMFSAKKYIASIQAEFANIHEPILVAVSGGVDSSTTAALLQNAHKDVQGLFIDTGFLRRDERKNVEKYLKTAKIKFKTLDATHKFYDALKGIADPEEKREVFRRIYFQILCDYMEKNRFSNIAQGTQFHQSNTKVYHNNPTQTFLQQNIKIIEPVKGLTKNEVRAIAKALHLPEVLATRRPFPGPGLLLRFEGEFSQEKQRIIRTVTSIVDEFISKHSRKFHKCYQIFPYLCSYQQITYVNKDGKSQKGSMVVIRAIQQSESRDTLRYIPFELKNKLRDDLVNQIMEVRGIARVCYDLTPKNGSGIHVKAGGTIEYS